MKLRLHDVLFANTCGGDIIFNLIGSSDPKAWPHHIYIMNEYVTALWRTYNVRFHQEPLGSSQSEMCSQEDNDFAACVQLMCIMGRMCILARHLTYYSYHPNRHIHNNKSFLEHLSPLEVMLCYLASSFWFLEESQCFHLKSQAVQG
jgi:hypothetical protein